MTLNTHPVLVPRSWKSRAVHLPTLWAKTRPVTGTFYFFVPLNALISQIYSWNENLHVSGSSSVHHQEFCTVNTAMVYVIQVR